MNDPLFDRLVGRLAAGSTPSMVAMPPGWEPIICRLADQLDEVWPGWELAQVKTKMGSLMVYLEPPPDEVADAVWQAVRDASVEAAATCERCGTTEGVERRSDEGWLSTLCAPCRHATS